MQWSKLYIVCRLLSLLLLFYDRSTKALFELIFVPSVVIVLLNHSYFCDVNLPFLMLVNNWKRTTELEKFCKTRNLSQLNNGDQYVSSLPVQEQFISMVCEKASIGSVYWPSYRSYYVICTNALFIITTCVLNKILQAVPVTFWANSTAT